MVRETVREMTGKYLQENGYDGLVGDECACWIKDLMPCNWDCIASCEAGHNVPGCSEDCGEGCDAHIVAGKRDSEAKDEQ